jgi:hypothetical protein
MEKWVELVKESVPWKAMVEVRERERNGSKRVMTKVAQGVVPLMFLHVCNHIECSAYWSRAP